MIKAKIPKLNKNPLMRTAIDERIPVIAADVEAGLAAKSLSTQCPYCKLTNFVKRGVRKKKLRPNLV